MQFLIKQEQIFLICSAFTCVCIVAQICATVCCICVCESFCWPNILANILYTLQLNFYNNLVATYYTFLKTFINFAKMTTISFRSSYWIPNFAANAALRETDALDTVYWLCLRRISAATYDKNVHFHQSARVSTTSDYLCWQETHKFQLNSSNICCYKTKTYSSGNACT